MRRDESSQLESAGQDSFLDVTTNIVGILIVLVIVVAMRVKSSPSKDHDEAKAKAESLDKQAAAVEYDLRRTQQQLETLESESDRQAADRELLAAVMVASEKELADRRATLEASAQEEFDLKRQIDETQRNIDRGKEELADLDSEKPPTQTINHYPTPLSRTVLGNEVHFQLKDGRITYVPLNEFIEDIRQSTRNIYEAMKKVNIVGPRNGFEMHYRLEAGLDRSGSAVNVGCEFQLVPLGLPPGESVDQALANRSDFRSMLSRHSPKDTTVTLWTYPNSFGDFRRVKEELYRMGYATAGRPLPDGVLIGGSSHGSRSSAQ
ncbi:MAG: hypothetical protein IT427_01655 [Pirellulales bacterium]|nr:hypothetical protein [Pirellulales bacterium]